MSELYVYKILILRVSNVGKAAFLKDLYIPGVGMDLDQIGVTMKLIKCTFNRKVSYTLQIWEFQNNKIIKYIYPQLSKGAKCLLVFFDITDHNSYRDLQYWIDITRKNVGNIPIIFVDIKRNLMNEVVLNEDIDSCVKNFKINRINFKSFNDYNRKELFKQLFKIINNDYYYNHLTILLSNNFEGFKEFAKYFSTCPICQKKNHFNNLKRFYFSQNRKIKEIKYNLIKLIQESNDFVKIFNKKIKVGILCCRCAKSYFDRDLKIENQNSYIKNTN
jgi:Ras-related protein Rab-1A/Rab family protein